MKQIFLLAMSLFSILFGCNSKKKTSKVDSWPLFPTTDNPNLVVKEIPLADGFSIRSFYIMPDKESVLVLGSRTPKQESQQEMEERQPGDPQYMDYRLLCLDAEGNTKFHKDLLHTDWMYGGTFGLLKGELMLRIGDWLLVLDPKTFNIIEKIPVHNSEYIPWKETEMTRDEHQADYQKKFDALLNSNKSCKFLYWSPGREYLVFEQAAIGKRSAWSPISYEDEQLADLKQRLESIEADLNSHNLNPENNTIEITDGSVKLREVEYISAGTQFDYPNYKSRRILQYELTVNDQKVHFSTTDRDRHYLTLQYSDNLMLTAADGSIWVVYGKTLYRMIKA